MADDRAWAETRVGARGEVMRDLVGVPVCVDDNMLNARVLQPVERVVEQRAAAERQERLGRRLCQRAHSRAEPGREQHGGARPHAPISAIRSGGLLRCVGGISRSSACASGAASGRVNARSKRRQVRGPCAR
jgi:hypothetical protein